ncbi:MAG: AI-2E family transporter [Gammaproteobacteria bacterium]|nr:AI-2E family transporter [Gammaproteobacteria bacterium]
MCAKACCVQERITREVADVTDQRLITLIIIAASGWLLMQLAPILTPFVAAALLAYLCDPLVDRFEKLKLNRTSAVFSSLFIILLFMSSVFLLIVPMVSEQGSALASKFPGYILWIENHWLPTIKEWMGIEDSTQKIGLAAVFRDYGDKIAQLLSGALGTVSRSGGAILTTLLNVVLIPVLTFYMLRDFDILVAKAGKLVPPSKRDRVFLIARESDAALSNFLKGQTVVMLGLALIWSVGLSIVGLEYALAIGVLSGLLSFVPYLGPAVGLLLGGVSALVQSPDLWMLAGVIAVFVVSQMIENYFLTPKFVGDRIGLHPVMVIFSVMAGGQLFGFFGVLLALPVAAVGTVLLRHFFEWFAYKEPVINEHDVDVNVEQDAPGD